MSRPPPVRPQVGAGLRAMRDARRRRALPHTGGPSCECLACHAGQLAIAFPTAPVAVVPDVPADRLLAGPGERRVCERDSECLDAWVRAHGDDEAHCPARCTRYEPVDRRHYWASAHAVVRRDTDGDLPDWSGDE